MTLREFGNMPALGYCPVCGSRDINTAGYCPEHQNITIRYSNLPDIKFNLDDELKKRAKNAPGIEKIHQITKRLPSFTKLIDEGR